MSDHYCHAMHCNKEVPPRMFMCSKKHWPLVPEPFKKLIWKYYRSGQEVRKDPSMNYLLVAELAQLIVFCLETGTILEHETESVIVKVENLVKAGASVELAKDAMWKFDDAYCAMREGRQ